MFSGFQDKEMRRTKFVVDKVSGIFNIDERYEHHEEIEQFHPLEVFFFHFK